MSLSDLPSDTSITTLFGLLNQHLYDNFARCNQQHLSKFNQEFKNEFIKFLNINADEGCVQTFTTETLPKFLFKLFNTKDPYLIGDFAINIIRHAKSKNILWFDNNLKDFCKNFTLTIHHQQNIHQQQQQPTDSQSLNNNSTTIITNTISNDTHNDTTTQSTTTVTNDSSNQPDTMLFNNLLPNDQITLSKTELLALLNDFNKTQSIQLNNFFNKSITTEIREQHFNDLKSLTDVLVHFSNAKSINEAHTKNNVFPKSLHLDRFPFPFYNNDPKYVHDYNKLIESFQKEIMNFILIHQTKTILETEDLIKSKLDFIESYDSNIKIKYSILKDEIVKSKSEILQNGFEKINKLIANKDNLSNSSSKPKFKHKKSKQNTKSTSKPSSRTQSVSRPSSPSIKQQQQQKNFNTSVANPNSKLNKQQNTTDTNTKHFYSHNNRVRFPTNNYSNFNQTQSLDNSNISSTYVTPNTRQYRTKSPNLNNTTIPINHNVNANNSTHKHHYNLRQNTSNNYNNRSYPNGNINSSYNQLNRTNNTN